MTSIYDLIDFSLNTEEQRTNSVYDLIDFSLERDAKRNSLSRIGLAISNERKREVLGPIVFPMPRRRLHREIQFEDHNKTLELPIALFKLEDREKTLELPKPKLKPEDRDKTLELPKPSLKSEEREKTLELPKPSRNSPVLTGASPSRFY